MKTAFDRYVVRRGELVTDRKTIVRSKDLRRALERTIRSLDFGMMTLRDFRTVCEVARRKTEIRAIDSKVLYETFRDQVNRTRQSWAEELSAPASDPVLVEGRKAAENAIAALEGVVEALHPSVDILLAAESSRQEGQIEETFIDLLTSRRPGDRHVERAQDLARNVLVSIGGGLVTGLIQPIEEAIRGPRLTVQRVDEYLEWMERYKDAVFIVSTAFDSAARLKAPEWRPEAFEERLVELRARWKIQTPPLTRAEFEGPSHPVGPTQ
jgi:hypothetical protein